MDLQQRKLTKSEWNATEVPVSNEEEKILTMIIKGYHDVNIRHNDTKTLFEFMKVQNTEEMVEYLYFQYFQEIINKLSKKYALTLDIKIIKKMKKKIRKADIIRIENTEAQLKENKKFIYEFILLDVVSDLLKYRESKNDKWLTYYYSLCHLITNQTYELNKYIKKFIDEILELYDDEIKMTDVIKRSFDIIEKNKHILKYGDLKLYEHQKELFTICKNPNPKLVLYIAPTGTGKTLSPLGLSESHKIIFVCAARHVGLALAKSAITLGKKVAFAFGCNDAEDIRLHYFAAKEFIKDRRSGGIRKVDNSVGDKVEIMICDIKSYTYAMYYMNAFNKKEDIILYWDEPTITLDYDDHKFHSVIKDNWSNNIIPNIVLSSATLPKDYEINDTIMDFRSKFPDSTIYNIISHDCKKTIPLVNKDGYVELPHFMYKTYEDVLCSVKHCEEYKTLLRYFDLKEVVKFVTYVNKNKYYTSSRYSIKKQFTSIKEITMINIKLYYLVLLKNIKPEKWDGIYSKFHGSRKQKHKSNVYITTHDAHTLTDGPTIFLCDNTEKIAKFALQTAKIPNQVMKDLMQTIHTNNNLTNKINELEKKLEDEIEKSSETDKGKEKKIESEIVKLRSDCDDKTLLKTIHELREKVQTVALNDLFIPNRLEHIKQWSDMDSLGATFTSDIDESHIEKIMLLSDVDNSWKILLMMGIGVFTNHKSIAYTEIMKELAEKQKLYIIIASTDYIYGTNYQFCHGYISKDLGDMTQEKIIQAMGRVGRNNIQHDYSIRFRDDDILKRMFVKEENKKEVINMNRLFNSD